MHHAVLAASPCAPHVSPPAYSSPRHSRLVAEGTRLTRITADESALFAVTRDSRHDADLQQFVRLGALLEKQLPEIGSRLVRLAECNGDGARRPRARSAHIGTARSITSRSHGDESDIMRDLLGRHKGLINRLREASAVRAARFEDDATAKLLADLIAGHEEDAFTLRALLWEVSNTGP